MIKGQNTPLLFIWYGNIWEGSDLRPGGGVFARTDLCLFAVIACVAREEHNHSLLFLCFNNLRKDVLGNLVKVIFSNN